MTEFFLDTNILWWYFVAIAAVEAVALLIFWIVTSRIDKRKPETSIQ